jgi:hypothetical protein
MRMGMMVLAGATLIAACGPSGEKPYEAHHISTSYSFTITPDQSPPHAREQILYKVFIRDRKTREPIQNGEGQIYSNNKEGARTWDGFTYGPQVGTYYGKLSFVAAGEWAVAIRFRRDSLHPLETINWMQDVHNERPSNTP